MGASNASVLKVGTQERAWRNPKCMPHLGWAYRRPSQLPPVRSSPGSEQLGGEKLRIDPE
jgi:hypothetical protein